MTAGTGGVGSLQPRTAEGLARPALSLRPVSVRDHDGQNSRVPSPAVLLENLWGEVCTC